MRKKNYSNKESITPYSRKKNETGEKKCCPRDRRRKKRKMDFG